MDEMIVEEEGTQEVEVGKVGQEEGQVEVG